VSAFVEGNDARRLPIIGRESALIDALTRALNEAIGGPEPSKKTMAQLRLHESSRVIQTARGNSFEVRVHGPDHEITGHIVRVTVELERFERS
jgi:hypothetical protein